MIVKPDVKPARPWFSAGPTAKRAGYALGDLPSDLLGRGIRAPEVVERFAHGLRLTREVLEVPDSHVMLYTPGSDTGAVEAALWGMLGARPVQVVAYENFGLTWLADVKDHLGLEPEALTAPWGELPDLSRADWSKDVIFPWNGTTSGVRVPDAELDRGRSRGAGHLRRHLGRLRHAAAVRQAGCGDLQLPEGAGRRGRHRGDGAVAAQRWSGWIHIGRIGRSPSCCF